MSDAGRVRIHYRRLPDRVQIFDQKVVLEREDVIVTLAESTRIDRPLRVGGQPILEGGSSVVWFTFPGCWHDIGSFHLRDGTFTGYYANILTPPVMEGPEWHTTDLFLDVWLPSGGEVQLLDVDEFEEALTRSVIEPPTAERARAEADRILGLAQSGNWPPPVVEEWPLERVRSSV